MSVVNVVLIGDSATQTVRAYERNNIAFSGDPNSISSASGNWQITENALIGPEGLKLPRVSGHVAYWFAWDGYLGAGSELYQASQ